jgi:hypothetical protein
LSEERVAYRLPNDDKWAWVRNAAGRATNVRVLRGTTVIEILHKGEKVIVDISQIEAIDLAVKCAYNG